MVQPSTSKKYFELTKKQLYKRLERRGYALGTINNIIRRAQEKRKALLKAERMRYGVYQPWDMLITELLAEMHRTRAKIDKYESKKYNHPDRAELFKAYLLLLQKRLYSLRLRQQREKQTPEALGKPHWSDWIPEEVKRPFIERHAELFNKPNTRTAAPLFSVRKVMIRTQRAKRVDEWKQDLYMYESSYDDAVASNDEGKAAWAKYAAHCVEQALLRLANVGIRKAPQEWMQILTPEERAELSRLTAAFTTTEEKEIVVPRTW